jgi:hypothetical protein
VEAPDFSTARGFTVNTLPIIVKNGYGIGTHDLILEQAIAQAIYGGADVSWIDVNAARNATSDPDHVAAVKKRFRLGGDYRGFRAGGTGPVDAGVIYGEICEALEQEDFETASMKLGWLAHFLGDISQPFHNCTWKQGAVIPAKGWHDMHLAFELDLDYYIEYTVGNLRSKWRDDVAAAVKYVPGLADVTDETSPQDVRLIWFGGEYKKPPKPGKTARQVAISVSKKVRDNYTVDALKAWKKTWKKNGYEAQPEFHASRGTGTKYLLTNAPAMLSASATGLATLITALSDPELRETGIDHIKKPKVSVKAKKLEKKTAKKNAEYKATFTVKNNEDEALYEFPVFYTWRDEGKDKVVKSGLLWTDKNGKVTSTVAVKRRAKAYKLSVKIVTPASDYSSAVVKTVKVGKKKK